MCVVCETRLEWEDERERERERETHTSYRTHVLFWKEKH